jgi:hypothetical protein
MSNDYDAPLPQQVHPVDPTRSPRVVSNTLLEEQPLTQRRHIDADLHWIGESLPIPALTHARYSGLQSHPGLVAHPARADHTHDARMYYGAFYTTDQHMNPGTSYFNNLQFGQGTDMRASAQVIGFSIGGLYLIQCYMLFKRDGGGTFLGELNVFTVYNNGGATRYIYRESVFDIPFFTYITATDMIVVNEGAAPHLQNVQFAVEFTDSVGWTANIQQVVVTRLASPYSATIDMPR